VICAAGAISCVPAKGKDDQLMETYILGASLHPPAPAVTDKRLEEMVFDTARAALSDARVSRQELDHVTIAACDELDGRSISSMLLAAPAGAYLKDEIKVTDSGLIGLCLEALRIESGRFQLGLLVSWNKSSEAPFEDVMRMRCEPFYTRPIGLNMSIADGLFAQAVSHAYGFDEHAASKSVRASYERAARNERGLRRPVPSLAEIEASSFVAAPLRKEHQAPVTDGAVAMVVCSASWLGKHRDRQPIARLMGVAWRTQSYQLGEHRLSGLDGFKASFAGAIAMSRLKDANDLDLVELESQTAFHELAYRRALDMTDTAKVSPSGGPFAQNPYFCAGLVGAAEAVFQVSGRAGGVQVPGARRAAAHGCHGFAQQGNAVAIFEGV
jgi:acetyl-CoA acetyltransferase